MGRELYDEKYEQKRLRLSISLTQKEQQYFINSIGKIPTGFEIKKIAMEKPFITITKNVNPDLKELLYELKKIGVNINQIAHKRNAKFEVNNIVLEQEITRLNELTKHIYKTIKDEDKNHTT